MARYESSGALDTSFDADGMVTTDFGGTYDYAIERGGAGGRQDRGRRLHLVGEFAL